MAIVIDDRPSGTTACKLSASSKDQAGGEDGSQQLGAGSHPNREDGAACLLQERVKGEHDYCGCCAPLHLHIGDV